MVTFDLSPLFRSTIGFDRLPDVLQAAAQADRAEFSYPPYNIEKIGKDEYRIVIALAGFTKDDLEIVSEQSRLTVCGKLAEREDADFLHRGIAGRSFERRFELADFIEVKGATMEDGLLTIELKRELPENLRPRRIAISQAKTKALERAKDRAA